MRELYFEYKFNSILFIACILYFVSHRDGGSLTQNMRGSNKHGWREYMKHLCTMKSVYFVPFANEKCMSIAVLKWEIRPKKTRT